MSRDLPRRNSRRPTLMSLASLPRDKVSLKESAASLQRSAKSFGSSVAHYAALVVAENPIEEHHNYLGRLQEDAEQEEASVDTDGRANLASEMQIMPANIGQHKKHEVRPRFAALVEIEQRLHGSPHKKLLMRTLELKDISSTDRVTDMLLNEVLLTGERIFDFFTPAKMGHHMVLFTFAMAFACFVVFYYMVGAYPLFLVQSNPSISACISTPSFPKGRQLFVDWMFPGGAIWCFEQPKWVMNAAYLKEWGARYGPLMKAQPSRWFTSWFIHQSFVHVTSNMALFAVIAYQVEEKYGFWRITLLYFISALGGSFFSAAFESSCKTVQGASGGAFGMMGLFIADLILNFETIKRPLLRGLLMLGFLVYFILSAALSSGSSSIWSHIGGFLCGLFPSFLFLPNLRSEKWEQILPILGGFVLLGVFTALPVYVYRNRLPGLQCAL